MTFLNRVRAGVAVVNGGTYGSEPHLPFGGLGIRATAGVRPGPRSLDVYSDWKTFT